MLVAQQHQHQHQHHFLQYIQHQRLSILVPQLFMALYSVRNMAQHAATNSVEFTYNMRRNEHCLWQQWRDSSSSNFMNEDTCRKMASLPYFLRIRWGIRVIFWMGRLGTCMQDLIELSRSDLRPHIALDSLSSGGCRLLSLRRSL